MTEKVFHGIRSEKAGPAKVTFDGKPLDPRNDIMNHSPDGFQWGYEGSGPAQLALAMLCAIAGPAIARRHYQDFKRERLAIIDRDEWHMTEGEVRRWINGRWEYDGQSKG